MPLPIEDYALIGDGHTAALVGRDGSIDWLCLPRFDSGACFAALLGGPEHGRWAIAPRGEVTAVSRRYREGTLILETDFETALGTVRVIDCMPLSNERWDVLRIVVGLRGCVAMSMELVIRFDYGSIVPWVRRRDGTLFATAGPDTLELHTPVHARGEQMTSRADFESAPANVCLSYSTTGRRMSRRSRPSTPNARWRRPSVTGMTGPDAAASSAIGRTRCCAPC